MAEFKDRLNEAINERDISPAQLAKMSGVNEGAISQYRKGKYKATQRNLEKLAITLQVSIPWLMGGDVPMEPTAIPLPSNVLPLPKTHKVPLLGSIACGAPILAEENMIGQVDLADGVHADFALQCKGDSMINARIFDGDLVYIRIQPEVENGEIAAVRIGDEATLKRVYYTPGSNRITLRACNPLYPDQEYSGSRLDEVKVLGKAVAFFSSIL